MISSSEYNEHIFLSRREQRIYSKWCKKKGISHSMLIILDLLCENSNGLEPSVISENLFICKQTLTGLLHQLESDGYITHKKDKRDKRKKLIILTEEGKGYTESLLEDLYAVETKVIDILTGDEKQKFNKFYLELVNELEKQLLGEEE